MRAVAALARGRVRPERRLRARRTGKVTREMLTLPAARGATSAGLLAALAEPPRRPAAAAAARRARTRSPTRTSSSRSTAATSCITAACRASTSAGSGRRRCWRCAARSRRGSRPRCGLRSGRSAPRRRRRRWTSRCARSRTPTTARRSPRYIEREATREQVLEFIAHRSAYQLKEADPHSWAIPRLSGAPKAALVEIQADEYGGGRAERVHARAVRRRDGGGRARLPLRRLRRRAAGGDARDRQPDVALRPAPAPARRDRRPPRAVRDDVLDPQPPLRDRSAPARRSRPPRRSSTSTSRPTPCTRRSRRSTSPAASRAPSRRSPTTSSGARARSLLVERRWARRAARCVGARRVLASAASRLSPAMRGSSRRQGAEDGPRHPVSPARYLRVSEAQHAAIPPSKSSTSRSRSSIERRRVSRCHAYESVSTTSRHDGQQKSRTFPSMTQFTSGRGRPVSVTQLDEQLLKHTARVERARVRGQQRIQGTRSGATRVAREELAQVGEVEQAPLLRSIDGASSRRPLIPLAARSSSVRAGVVIGSPRSFRDLVVRHGPALMEHDAGPALATVARRRHVQRG